MRLKPFFFVLIIFLSASFINCKNGNPDEINELNSDNSEDIKYSFFIAGHTYGSSQNHIYGLHTPFVQSIPFLNDYPNMKMGVLTGDVVPKFTAAYWDSAQVTMAKFNFPIHIAAGNHDRGREFLNRFDKYYHSFTIEKDLFIVLSPTRWNIEGAQKDFLIETIQQYQHQVNNIFIFCHELIWWDPDNKFGNIKINYVPHYPGETNYLTEVKPLLDTLPNEVVFFAGDLGNTSNVDSYMYYKEGNITLIGSGMGSGVSDNIIIIGVKNNGTLDYKLLSINTNPPSKIMELEDYTLP